MSAAREKDASPRGPLRWLALVLLLAAAVGTGWWAGQRSAGSAPAGAHEAAAGGAPGSPGRRLLYYRNPMGLPDTSPVPKKDPMGMDYVPVYEGDDAAPDAPGAVVLTPAKIQKLGVRTEPAQARVLERAVRAAGRVEIDERRVHAVAPRFDGWVERLHVNVTGQAVARGQPLFEVYSPELVSAQREYAIALQGEAALKGAGPDAQAGMRHLADAAIARLRNWEIPADQLDALARTGEPRRTLTLRAPASGVITEKKAVQGMRFMAGESLYQIADLSAVWVIADVASQDAGAARRGARARIAVDAYPGRSFDGTIAYVYPTMNAETRTVPVRIELANPGGLLKPSMYAEVSLAASAGRRAVTVPASAVIDSGLRQVVLVQAGEGRFEPREVRLGERGDAHVEVLSGVREGEPVVVSANFLIDAESNLRAALQGLGANGGAGAPAAGGVVHRAEGTVESIDARAGTLELSHGPVASLKWPAMTMEFSVANPSLAAAVRAGQAVRFEFVERKPGEWVVTRIEPAAAPAPAPARAAPAPAPAPGKHPAGH